MAYCFLQTGYLITKHQIFSNFDNWKLFRWTYPGFANLNLEQNKKVLLYLLKYISLKEGTKQI